MFSVVPKSLNKVTMTKIKLLAVSLTVTASLLTSAQAAEWGFRAGFADDPDQVVVGAQLMLGKVLGDFQFVPNVELGLGDDHTILAATAALHYDFKTTETAFTPYAGGGIVGGLVDRDKPKGDDTDFELAAKAIGGLKRRLSSGNQFFMELNLLFDDDLHDFEILAGLTFKRQKR